MKLLRANKSFLNKHSKSTYKTDGRGGSFSPKDLGNLELWCKWNQGITVTGSGVSQWDDQSGNGNHLKQATDGNRPAKQSDGSILFDGVDNFLKADAFTLNQPTTVYLLGKQVTWTDQDYIYDGNTLLGGSCRQLTATPNIRQHAGVLSGNNTDWVLDTDAVVTSVFNSTSSLLQVNNETAITGDAGTNNMGGFTLGVRGDLISGWSNIQVKEVIIYSVAHDANTRTKVVNYLGAKGELGI